MVDTKDLKSFGQKWLCGFESRSGHISRTNLRDLPQKGRFFCCLHVAQNLFGGFTTV